LLPLRQPGQRGKNSRQAITRECLMKCIGFWVKQEQELQVRRQYVVSYAQWKTLEAGLALRREALETMHGPLQVVEISICFARDKRPRVEHGLVACDRSGAYLAQQDHFTGQDLLPCSPTLIV